MIEATSEAPGPERPVLYADTASWLQNRLRAFGDLAMLLGSYRARSVSADEEMYSSALEGALRGQAREITREMGFIPGENLESMIPSGRPISGSL